MAKRVMVVDDSREVHVQMASLLEDTDYEVAAFCRSGEEAVGRYGQAGPDLVTMDIIMPGMDGLKTAQTILERDPDARIVMVSELAYHGTFEEAEALGARGFVGKPFGKERLLEAFWDALR